MSDSTIYYSECWIVFGLHASNPMWFVFAKRENAGLFYIVLAKCINVTCACKKKCVCVCLCAAEDMYNGLLEPRMKNSCVSIRFGRKLVVCTRSEGRCHGTLL